MRFIGRVGSYLVALLLARCVSAQERAAVRLPDGVKAVWDVGKAFREATPTRERISINGLWRWRPAADEQTPPPAGWGYLRVPSLWPVNAPRASRPQIFYPDPAWKALAEQGVDAAWYEREITVPNQWAGRRISLYAEYVNSYGAIYIDGKRAGEIRYPAGEADLTAAVTPGRTHLLSMHVIAMPLKAVMQSFSDTASAKTVEGAVVRRGLCGDVYLVSMPKGPVISEVRVETSVRRWQITFNTKVASLNPAAHYSLRAVITDGNRQAREVVSSSFQESDLVEGRIHVTANWKADKLWDLNTPANQYSVSVSLMSGGKVLDTALPSRFGFRELWIDGRDFYLNGTRIYLSAVPLDNAQGSATMASYEATRNTLQLYKSRGVNFVYTHNYGCEPGTHISFEEILRAADDEGVLVSLSQPHAGQYDWTAPGADKTNGYAQHAAFFVGVAGNHPSVVFYSANHNSAGYAEDMNPNMTDGILNARDAWSLRNAGRALRAENIVRKMDPSRIYYHHAGGNLGPMHTVNFYANWVPEQEMSDWFEHWATTGVKPLFLCEYSVPMLWDWAMYRGWYKGKRDFGAAVAPWEFLVAEFDAPLLGDRAYRITGEEKKNLRWEAEQFRAGRVWRRSEYPYHLNTAVFENRFRVVSKYYEENTRAFRTWGISAADVIWDWESYWIRASAGDRTRQDLKLEIDWEHLQRPGPRPVFVREGEARRELSFHPEDYRPTLVSESIYRNNRPLLAYIAGKPDAFTSRDHNFLPGETVRKQLVIINNSRETIAADCAWSFNGVKGATKISLPTGEQQRIPLTFELPSGMAAGSYTIEAAVRFDKEKPQSDTFTIDVLPRPAAAPRTGRIALFDPKGETRAALQSLGVAFQTVTPETSLRGYDTLIVGKAALGLDSAAPDIGAVRDGLKVLVFEQTGEVLEKRFGFRIQEYGLRKAFPRIPHHPLTAGITENLLHDWRGAATLLPPQLTYDRTARYNFAPQVNWAGVPVTRAWRAGNRGNVASALIEKPARGDFMPIVDGGYALQYSALMEYREGAGMVLFCQLDVTGRTEQDPAASALAANILGYVAGWKPEPRRKVVYAGDPAGRKYLESAGFPAPDYSEEALGKDMLLVVGPGGGSKLAPGAKAISTAIQSGGRVLAIGLDAADANAFLPTKVAFARREYIGDYFEPFSPGSPFAGISAAETRNRDPREMPLVSGDAKVFSDGALAIASGGSVVLTQLVPWQMDYSGEKMNVKRTFRCAARLTSRLLGNMGAPASTPLLSHFSTPVRTHEQRYLSGLYLDQPEEWDDPYRFFRW